MSWTQGLSERDELPPALVERLDSMSEGQLEAITWNPEEGSRFMAHFYKDGEYLEARAFLIGTPPARREHRGE